MITIDGKKYVVIENLGFIHDRGTYGKVIDFNGEDRIVIKSGHKWVLAKPIIAPSSRFTGMGEPK